MPLQATSKFQLSRAYYQQLRGDWLRYISRWRRFSIPFGVFLIVLAVVLHFGVSPSPVFTFLMIASGLAYIVHYIHHQRKWIQDRLTEKSFNHEVEITFTDDKITISGPQGSGFCRWDAFERTLITPRGLFLWPRKGVNIYIPDSSLIPLAAKEEIAAKIGQP